MSRHTMTALALLLAAGLFSLPATAQTLLRCNMDHPGGDREQGVIALTAAGELSGFTWLYRRRSGGSCDIRADSFRVAGADLLMGREGCQLMTWRQGTNLTLAFSPGTPGCQSYCTSRAVFESILPVVFDLQGRGCGG